MQQQSITSDKGFPTNFTFERSFFGVSGLFVVLSGDVLSERLVTIRTFESSDSLVNFDMSSIDTVLCK